MPAVVPRCAKCPAAVVDSNGGSGSVTVVPCPHNPVQQGDVSSTEPPLPESSTNGGQPETSAYFEAIEYYTSNAGWVLLEINAEGIIECVSQNVKELIQFTRQELHKQSIYTFLHPGDHKILSPILNNMTFSQGWESLDDVDGLGGGGPSSQHNNNDNNNNSLTGSENCFAGSGGGGSSSTNGGAVVGNNQGSGGGSSSSSNSSSTGGGVNNNNNNTTTPNNNNNNNSTSTAGLSPKRSIKSRIRMLLKHMGDSQETVEQKQRRQDRYEEVVIIAAPVRDGDEYSSVLCLITRPEDESLGDGAGANTVHSQVQQHHNQHINAQQPPQLMQANLEQLTLKLAPSGKILSCNMATLRESFQKHLAKEPATNLLEMCHYQDQPVLQKHLTDVLLASGPHHAMYRLRLGAPEVYVHCKTQSKVFQGSAPPAGDGDFIMAIHTILLDSDVQQQNNLMSTAAAMGPLSSNNPIHGHSGDNMGGGGGSSNTSTSSAGMLMSPSGGGGSGGGSMGVGSQMIMVGQGGGGGAGSLTGMMQQQQHPHQNQHHQQQIPGTLPNYFQQQQQNKLIGNLPNGGGGGGIGGPLMTSVINGGGQQQQQQQQQLLQNRVAMIKPDPSDFMLNLDILAESSFSFDMDDFETSPVSRASLTPVNNNNNSRPPSVSTVYSPLPTPLTPFQMQPNNSTSALSDAMQASPGGRQTPNTGNYHSAAGGSSSFSFAGFGDDSQGSSTGGGGGGGGVGGAGRGDKVCNRQAQQQQQQMMDTTRLRILLTNPQSAVPGGSNAVSPPLGSGMGPKKGGAKKNSSANDARQSNQILKVSVDDFDVIVVVRYLLEWPFERT